MLETKILGTLWSSSKVSKYYCVLYFNLKIDLFTKFEEKMGYANILKITKTYRNSQELIDIAGGFVMANDEQIKKSLKSNKTIKDPVILMSYNDSYEKDENDKGPFYRLGEAIENSLDHIVSVNGEEKNVRVISKEEKTGLGVVDRLERTLMISKFKLKWLEKVAVLLSMWLRQALHQTAH